MIQKIEIYKTINKNNMKSIKSNAKSKYKIENQLLMIEVLLEKVSTVYTYVY